MGAACGSSVKGVADGSSANGGSGERGRAAGDLTLMAAVHSGMPAGGHPHHISMVTPADARLGFCAEDILLSTSLGHLRLRRIHHLVSWPALILPGAPEQGRRM